MKGSKWHSALKDHFFLHSSASEAAEEPTNAGPSLIEVPLESKHGYSRESPGLHDQPRPLTLILKGALPHPRPPTELHESLASCWPTLNRDDVGNTHFLKNITPGKAAHRIRTRCCMLPLLCWLACLSWFTLWDGTNLWLVKWVIYFC